MPELKANLETQPARTGGRLFAAAFVLSLLVNALAVTTASRSLNERMEISSLVIVNVKLAKLEMDRVRVDAARKQAHPKRRDAPAPKSVAKPPPLRVKAPPRITARPAVARPLHIQPPQKNAGSRLALGTFSGRGDTAVTGEGHTVAGSSGSGTGDAEGSGTGAGRGVGAATPVDAPTGDAPAPPVAAPPPETPHSVLPPPVQQPPPPSTPPVETPKPPPPEPPAPAPKVLKRAACGTEKIQSIPPPNATPATKGW